MIVEINITKVCLLFRLAAVFISRFIRDMATDRFEHASFMYQYEVVRHKSAKIRTTM